LGTSLLSLFRRLPGSGFSLGLAGLRLLFLLFGLGARSGGDFGARRRFRRLLGCRRDSYSLFLGELRGINHPGIHVGDSAVHGLEVPLGGKYEVPQTSHDNDDRQDDQKSLHTFMLTPRHASSRVGEYDPGPGERTGNSEQPERAS